LAAKRIIDYSTFANRMQRYDYEEYRWRELALKANTLAPGESVRGFVYLPKVANARYLHGFIDLVYEHQGKFYIADYKSNYLGDDYACYQLAALQQNMSNSSYWLQAVLYQLALHRYLKLRLPDYQPQQHLGGAVYLYLRGMQPDCSETGILHWQASEVLLNALDALMGQHDPYQ
ncbi:MAG: hypothetical protein EOO68_35335, partial [Moraxellaceae bacterium]